MTALSQERMNRFERWKYRNFTLAASNAAYKGGLVGLDLSTGKVERAHSAETDLLVIGKFAETKASSGSDQTVNVELARELEVHWQANDSEGTPVASTDVGKLCYVLDDQTVTMDPGGAAVAGRVWAVDSTKGVAVELLMTNGGAGGGLAGDGGAIEDALPAFAAGNLNVPDAPRDGTIYDVPTTATNSTITLPATANEGTRLYFVADGTKNGHTVQYRDATGPVNLTTALTASKRHMVVAAFLNGIWNANAYVSP